MKLSQLTRQLLIVISVLIAYSPVASAALFPIQLYDAAHTRDAGYGYFTNGTLGTGQNVIPEGIYTVDVNSFVTAIKKHYNTGDTHHKAGAAFIILTMLGVNAGTVNVGSAGAYIPQWETIVRQYDAAGRIDWGLSMFFPCGVIDSYYQADYGDAAFYQTQQADAPECNSNHDVIRFKNADGSTYIIKMECANVMGDISPIAPVATYKLKALLAGTSSTTLVTPGSTITLHPGALNTTIYSSNRYNLDTIQTAGPAVAGLQSFPGEPVLTGLAQRTKSYSITVPNVPNGTRLCFVARVSPSTPLPGSFDISAPPTCFVVYRIYTPSVVGNGSDVHAGGAFCDGTPAGIGNVWNGQSNSYGQYVVSATGIINNFSSNKANASAPSSKDAHIGVNGGYIGICRANLSEVAAAYRAANPLDMALLGGGTYSLTELYAQASIHGTNIVYVTGDLNVTNALNRRVTSKLTIVSTGAITIAGNINQDLIGSYKATTQPSLGIIAGSYINVIGSVTSVSAYLFAGNYINTCSAAPCVGPVNGTLNINGFLMAGSMSLRRQGQIGGASTTTVGENVVMTAQLYLNPPMFFGNSNSLNKEQSLGERPTFR